MKNLMAMPNSRMIIEQLQAEIQLLQAEIQRVNSRMKEKDDDFQD